MRSVIIILCLLTTTALAQKQTTKSDGFKGKVKKVRITTYNKHSDTTRSFEDHSVEEIWYGISGEAEKGYWHLWDVAGKDTIMNSEYDRYYENGNLMNVVSWRLEHHERWLDGYEVYLYNKNDKLLEETDHSISRTDASGISPDTTIERTVNSYDNKGRKILSYIYQGTGGASLQKKSMYKTLYISRGKKVEYKYIYANDNLLAGLSGTTKEENSKSRKVYGFYDANDSLDSKAIWKQLADGRMHVVERWSKNSGSETVQYTFSNIDEHGNYLKAISTNGTSKETMIYEIEYYE